MNKVKWFEAFYGPHNEAIDIDTQINAFLTNRYELINVEYSSTVVDSCPMVTALITYKEL